MIKSKIINLIQKTIGTILGELLDFKNFILFSIYIMKKKQGLNKLETFEGECNANKKICVFSLYQPRGIPKHVFHQLSSLKELGFSLYVISNCPITENDIQSLKKLCFKIVIRDNIGRDFGGYKLGVLDVLDHFRNNLERLMLANDSVFFPVHNPTQMFESVDLQNNDFWGISENHEQYYHVASYLIVFKPSSFNHPEFSRYWNSYLEMSSRRHSIRKGEAGLSKALVKAGLTPGVICSSKTTLEYLQDLPIDKLVESLSYTTHIAKRATELQKMISLKIYREDMYKTYENMMRMKLLHLVSTYFDSGSPIHFCGLLINKYGSCPILKKDLIYRNAYEFGFLLANLSITTNLEFSEVESFYRMKGRPKTISFINQCLLSRGYI